MRSKGLVNIGFAKILLKLTQYLIYLISKEVISLINASTEINSKCFFGNLAQSNI
jgi:hypothetical protein